jgi:hypothetical protein
MEKWCVLKTSEARSDPVTARQVAVIQRVKIPPG